MNQLFARILVIDDEPQIHRFLGPALDAAGYHHLRADNGAQGLREIATWSPDVVILDLGLPDMDGKDVLVKARTFYDGPILILSARDKEGEKIEAFERGANDYVEKPFGIGELLARIKAALRQRAAAQPVQSKIVFGDIEVDLDLRYVVRGGEQVKLPPKEYALLTRLIAGHGKVLTHKELLVAVWGVAHIEDTQYLRVAVGQLRQKLEQDASEPQHIITEPGIGYRLRR
ncbi:response regulator [Devosia sediminis]|uniref:Response regulator n=1 Tax=Devosia sediminis TaxID=2798801 RepID=A0A934MMM6_9HYPH|nr:response regulator [Devosia sediminis]MBJ3786375.1 response regulator [Devosia sediminis]